MMVAVLQKDMLPRSLALIATNYAYIDSGATLKVTQCKYILPGKVALTIATISIDTKDTIEAKTQVGSIVRVSCVKKVVRLNQVLYVPDVEHGLVSVSSLREDGDTVPFTKRNCAIKNENREAGVVRRAGGMNSVKLVYCNSISTPRSVSNEDERRSP